MKALREALEMWNRGEILVDGSPTHLRRISNAVESIVAAARAVLDSEEVWWCDFHKAAGGPGLDCWGAGINGQDSCSMVRRRLLPAESVDS